MLNGRYIEVAESSHRKGSRNGCGGHNETVRGGLLSQQRSLMNAEFVLFINYHQAEFVKLNIMLQQSDRADYNIYFAGIYLFKKLSSFFACYPAG